MTKSDTSQVLYYKSKSDWYFKGGLIVLVILTILMFIVKANPLYYLSSFVGHPQDFLLPMNEWSVECGDQLKRAGLTKFYLILDFFFPVFLAFVVVLLLRGSTLAYKEPDSNFRVFDFSLMPLKFNLASKVAIGFLILAIGFDWYENYLVYDGLVAIPYGDVNGDTYETVGNIKLALFIIPIALALGGLIYTYWLDFGKLWRKYIGHFYPSIIGVGFTFLVFSFFGQAFDFIVELVQPVNLIIFLILFMFALIGLWMIPYYLYYTRTLKGFENLGFGQILKYTIVPLIPAKDPTDIKVLEEEALQKRYRKFRHSEESFFHKIRRGIAIAFILTFLLIQLNLISEMVSVSSSVTSLVLAINVFGIWWISKTFRKAKHKDLEKIERDDKEADIIDDLKLNKKSKMFGLSSKLFLVVVFNSLIVAFHIVYCFIKDPNFFPGMENPDLISKLIIYSFHTFLFSWSFMIYALYRKVELKVEDFGAQINRGIYSFIKRISYTPTLIRMYFIFSLSAFIITSLIVGFDSGLIERLNPLNLFLIILNFFVALIAFIDRVIYASLKSRQISLGPRSAGVLIVAIVLLFIAINSKENNYHDLHRVTFSSQDDTNLLNLEEYTTNYLDKHEKDVVYFIAADGGGLKAAFWTMNILQDLNEKDTSFFDNVFMTTGASGGMVGLGMYTFMHGQDFNNSEKRTKIDLLGSTNFLNNDLAGLAIKSPLVQLVPPLAKTISDRTAAMSYRYFQLTSKNNTYFKEIRSKPFAHIWQERNYVNLPLLIVNTTKTEDGSRGIIHPLRSKKGDDMIGPFTDLTDFNYEGSSLSNINSLNLSDGLFTTNRFPIFSPFARIEGKGHFVDGGYLENSGLSTILHFLNYMKLEADSTNVFGQFFANKKIVVISIGNDRSSFIRNNFQNVEVNKSGSTGEVSAILGAISGGGLTALPQYYDYLFESLEDPKNKNSLNLDFIQVDMPFPFTLADINKVYQGQVVDCDLSTVAQEKKIEILKNVDNNFCSICPDSLPYYLTPPLGRFMSEPARDYMRDMIKHPEVEKSTNEIRSNLKD
jgi:hypothetical protein